MGKLIFTHGVMDSGKSSMLIQKAYQFAKKGIEVVVIKPCTDTRSPSGKVKSDVGIEWPCIDLGAEDNVFNALSKSEGNGPIKVVLVDEAQFLQDSQVDDLAILADNYGILVIAFGLKNDFTGHLFSASKRLIEVADRIDEIPSMCHCGHKATHHFLKQQSDTNIVIGDSDIYVSCCRQCYNKLKAGEHETN